MAAAPSVVVLGATGQVGLGLVPRLLARGFHVLAQGRTADRLDRLREACDHHPNLATVKCALSADADVRALAAAVGAQRHRPTLAIAALGGWYVGPELVELPAATWHGTLAANLTTHYIAARGVAPYLHGGRPVYLMLNGIASIQPCVGSGAISAAGAGQAMLAGVLRAESIGRRVRFRQLVVLGDITSVPLDEPAPGWIGIDAVTDAAVDLLINPDAPDDLTITAPEA
jgi:NAD(P)-dependent dehydrogenase (short-subunit alcohol dehydrogenase family)